MSAAQVLLTLFWGSLGAIFAEVRGTGPPQSDALARRRRRDVEDAGLALVAAVALGGFALSPWTAAHGRHARVSSSGYAVVGEALAGGRHAVREDEPVVVGKQRPRVGRHDGFEVRDGSLCAGAPGVEGRCSRWYTLTMVHAAAYLGALLLLAVVVSLVTFPAARRAVNK